MSDTILSNENTLQKEKKIKFLAPWADSLMEQTDTDKHV